MSLILSNFTFVKDETIYPNRPGAVINVTGENDTTYNSLNHVAEINLSNTIQKIKSKLTDVEFRALVKNIEAYGDLNYELGAEKID